MSRKLKKSFFLSLAAFALGLNAYAKDDAVLNGQGVMTAFPELSSNKYPILAEGLDLLRNSEIVPFAPAPALSSMWVYAVGSSNCDWEYTAGLSTTSCDHGGAQLRTAVLEIGYGSSRIAWMNGGILGSSYANTPVCVTGGYYTWPCTAGQTVVGFLVEYNLDGYQNGLFRYQNTSTNSPWNTMAVQISIL